jgi:hypothetical protein
MSRSYAIAVTLVALAYLACEEHSPGISSAAAATDTCVDTTLDGGAEDASDAAFGPGPICFTGQ